VLAHRDRHPYLVKPKIKAIKNPAKAGLYLIGYKIIGLESLLLLVVFLVEQTLFQVFQVLVVEHIQQ
jgi:hypothetical protein